MKKKRRKSFFFVLGEGWHKLADVPAPGSLTFAHSLPDIAVVGLWNQHNIAKLKIQPALLADIVRLDGLATLNLDLLLQGNKQNIGGGEN